jgi:rhamnose utilization protein RhaD (predicted bifunctional aldolase and dehydrogenase)
VAYLVAGCLDIEVVALLSGVTSGKMSVNSVASHAQLSLIFVRGNGTLMDTDMADVLEHLENDAILKDRLKEEVVNFEKKTRIMIGMLNKIHSTPPVQGMLNLHNPHKPS